MLLKGGQICGDYLLAWNRGILGAYVRLAGADAFRLRHHTRYGKEHLVKVKKAFGQNPIWTLLDDDAGGDAEKWKTAPSLYLFTHACDRMRPISHGGTGVAIPSYTIPVTSEQKEKLYCWERVYFYHDRIWLNCGALEIASCREMASPDSSLSKQGRELCGIIEAATKRPTYYYLQRYWARPKGEEKRKCPGCGGAWNTEWMGVPTRLFHQFEFLCKNCRLVSHLGVSTDGGRYARIGE